MKEYYCKTAQGGFSAGSAFVFKKREISYQSKEAVSEEERLDQAITELSEKLSLKRSRSGKAEAEILDAEIMILRDETYTDCARDLIRVDGLNAKDALEKTAQIMCEKLVSSGNDYIGERTSDVKGLTAALISILSGSPLPAPSSPCILVGEELSPGEVLLVEPEIILGILTEKGSPTSHLSVVAGTLGVPYLYGVKGLADKIRDGDDLILDGEKSVVIVNPDDAARSDAEQRTTKVKTNTAVDRTGFLRSEFLFLHNETAPSEEEQFLEYRRFTESRKGMEAVIRTMDLGSDKQAKWLPLPKESNPALGMRGIRVSLSHRDLFQTELKALLRAAVYGDLRIMIPMVTRLSDIDETKAEIKKAAEDLDRRGIAFRIPELGAMIETPSAVMLAPELAERVSFFSIGTNDLTQYTMAFDRESQDFDNEPDGLPEAVFRMIELVVKAARSRSIPVTICGEPANIPAVRERLHLILTS